MPLMRKERKSEYEHWPTGTPDRDPSEGQIELEKLRQLEGLKWAVHDLADELRAIHRRQSPRRPW